MRKTMLRCCLGLVAGLAVIGVSASAQTVAYRQTNLVSDLQVEGFARHVNPFLQNPWGIAFPPGQDFFIANAGNGRVLVEDGNGNGGPGAFVVPNPSRTGPALPTGIIADPNSFFGAVEPHDPFVTTVIVATANGGIYVWGIDDQGVSPSEAILVVDHSQAGAVYTGLAIVTPTCCAPFLVVANFHTGEVETYNTSFVALAPPGSFVDPNLPAGYAPYGMQVIGNQLFVASALQDADKHDPVLGSGNGIVSVFNFDGSFARRFVTAGLLNAPWGMGQAGGDFGPVSNMILVANTGDGAINAFDPATGAFAGQINDGEGNQIHDSGLHGLFFGSAAAGEANTLYFTAGINNGNDGLFGKITTGLVSKTTVSAPQAEAGIPVTLSVTVEAGTGNPGTPTGTVTIKDVGNILGTPSLVSGAATLDAVLTGIGTHNIRVLYSGDDAFLSSTASVEVEVRGRPTTLALVAPVIATPGSAVTLTATVTSTEGEPTGEVAFLNGNASVGTVSLNGAGAASLTISNLPGGNNTLTADYLGDGTFAGAASAPVNVVVADFSVSADQTVVTVATGQSTAFKLTINPTTPFATSVAFSCAPTAELTCAFNPATISPSSGPVSTTITVTALASSSAQMAALGPDLSGPMSLLAALMLFGLWMQSHFAAQRAGRGFRKTAGAGLFLAVLALGGCGGGGSAPTTNQRSTDVVVTAQAGAVTHSVVLHVTVQ